MIVQLLRRLSVGTILGAVILIVLVAQVAFTSLGAGDRADDMRAYTIFAAIASVAALLTVARGHKAGTLLFLVATVVCLVAGNEGLEVFWFYAAAFAVAALIDWGRLLVQESRKGQFLS